MTEVRVSVVGEHGQVDAGTLYTRQRGRTESATPPPGSATSCRGSVHDGGARLALC